MVVNFMRAGNYKCEFEESQLSFANVNFMRAEHWENEFVRAEHCKFEFYEH